MRRLLLCTTLLVTLAACSSAAPAAPPSTPGLWNIPRPPALDRGPLIQADGELFRIDPGWQVEFLAYSYSFATLGSSSSTYVEVKGAGSDYSSGSRAIPADAIAQLLGALDQLHPMPSLVGGDRGFDNYQTVAVEIRGRDGASLLLSKPTTPAPWNLIYNGHIYAVFDDHLAAPLALVFDGPSAEAPPTPSRNRKKSVSASWTAGFHTLPPPHELRLGFSGLLYLGGGFTYEADLDQEVIAGSVSADKLISVELRPPGQDPIRCTIAAGTYSGSFTCPTPGVKQDAPYRYPIVVTIDDGAHTNLEFSGELFGTWGVHLTDEDLLLGQGSNLDRALRQHPAAATLRNDLTLSTASFTGQVAVDDPAGAIFRGTAIFLGELPVVGRSVRFRLFTPFDLTGGALVGWTLDQPKLDGILAAVGADRQTLELVGLDPETIVEITYAEAQPPKLDLIFTDGWYGNTGKANCLSYGYRTSPDNLRPGRTIALREGRMIESSC